MTNDTDQPCLRRIDLDCFRARPEWAKQAFAYRLLHLLIPKELTKRLPKALRLALLAEGVTWPPGVEMPPGTVVGPDAEIPADWSAGDPDPAGIYIPPGTEFPAGWISEDPIPDGVIVSPGSEFPTDWTAGDPWPSGVIPPPTVPPDVQSSGLLPASGLAPWTVGRVALATGLPPSSPWQEYFTITYWYCGAGCDWTGSVWDFVIPYLFSKGILFVRTSNHWADDYRPTKIRITYTGTDITSLKVRDTDYNDIADPPGSAYSSGTELDLDFTPDLDLDSIVIKNSVGTTTFTQIEFYYE